MNFNSPPRNRPTHGAAINLRVENVMRDNRKWKMEKRGMEYGKPKKEVIETEDMRCLGVLFD